MAKSYRYEPEDMVRVSYTTGYECDECYGVIRGFGEVVTEGNITLHVCHTCAADIRRQIAVLEVV